MARTPCWPRLILAISWSMERATNAGLSAQISYRQHPTPQTSAFWLYASPLQTCGEMYLTACKVCHNNKSR